jgi:signal transduction histidine kinase
LKTPLAILQGELDLMRARPRSGEEVSAFLESASEEVSYLARMIEELLLLARIDAGAETLHLKEARVDEILIDCVARLERLASKKNVKLAVNLNTQTAQDDLSFVMKADPDLMRSLFETLIENAIKYSKDEGGLVTVELLNRSNEVQFQVTDQGEGIPSEALPKIFERFFRFEKVPGKKSGAGLGLAIAKKIVQVHSGTIDVENNADCGASFRVVLNKNWS